MDDLRVKFDGQVSKTQIKFSLERAAVFHHDGTLMVIFTSESHQSHFEAFSKYWCNYQYHEAYEVALSVTGASST